MIANGLIFLLGALVALLAALLLVPLLWRNAQRLARRDYAATLPATMNEIRAEVDRVRAETAMVVRRHEMAAQKAREQVAMERAAVGRLSATNALMSQQVEQSVGEATELRGQIATARSRIETLEAEHARLEEENADLKEAIAEAIAEAREIEAQAEADRLVPLETGSPPLDPEAVRETQDAARVAAATAALLAVAREQREGRRAAPTPDATAETAPGRPSRARASRSAKGAASSEEQVVDELRALAAAPRPSDLAERERQNDEVRERMADVAARVIQRVSQAEGEGSRTAALVAAPAEPSSDGRPTLAERVRRLSEPRPSPSWNKAADRRPVETAPVPNAETTLKTAPARARRKRGAALSPPPSQD